MVDSHNAKRHAPIGVETTWATKKWENRVFAFILAVTEVNVYLAMTYFYKYKWDSMLDFRKEFAERLIHNKYINIETVHESLALRRSKRRSFDEDHVLLTLPKKSKFSRGKIVEAGSEYPQGQCTGCKMKTRTFCLCSPGFLRCVACFAKHYATVGKVE
jgi:hypothetical protein